MRKTYALIIAAAALLALIISYSIPDEYAAQAKISDEYKVTDLAVGLNTINVLIRDLDPNYGNSGTDDIEVYAQIFLSEDFIDQIAQTEVSKYRQTFLDYLKARHRYPFWLWLVPKDEADYKQLIRDHINYNINPKAQTLDIQVLDQDPVVATEMMTETLRILKKEIERHRVRRTQVAKENALQKRAEAGRLYHEALDAYAAYANAHEAPSTTVAKNKLAALKDYYKVRHNIYERASEDYARADYLTQKENTSFTVVKNCNVPTKPLYPRHWVWVLVFCSIAALLCFWHALYTRRGQQKKLSLSFRHVDWFSPWTLTIAIWVLILSLYYIQDTQLYPITEQFYVCLALWIPIFCLCAWLTFSLMEAKPVDTKGGIDYNRNIFTFFFVISMIITPLYVYRILQIVMMFSTDDLMSNIRTLSIYGEGQGFLNYSSVINHALFAVAIWSYPKVPMWQVVLLALACLMNSLAIMEKGTMFFVFVCIIFVLFERRVIRLRSIAVSGVLLILVFYVFNLARSEDTDYQENETLLDFFAMYALSPPVAFCQLMREVTPQFGTNTFETIYLFLDRFGVQDIVVKEKLQQFVWVPIPTNVYTIFQPFYIDFGYQGVAYMAGLYGVISGWLYRLFRNGSGIACCLYTYIVDALVLQFYQENLFLDMVFVLQFAFFVCLLLQTRLRFVFLQPARL